MAALNSLQRKIGEKTFFLSGNGKKFNGTTLPETQTLLNLPFGCKVYPTYNTPEAQSADKHVTLRFPEKVFDFYFYGFDNNGLQAKNIADLDLPLQQTI